MFQSPGEGTLTRDPNTCAVEESTIVKEAVREIKKLAGEAPPEDMHMVHSNTMHINSIGKILLSDYPGRIYPWSPYNMNSNNMIGWHQYPTDLPKGFLQGCDEVMLALYNINEVIFDALVIYPFKIKNTESGQYDYKKHSFIRFIPHERTKHDKIYNESGFYRSQVNNVTIYYEEYSRSQEDKSADTRDKDLFVFAMYYDFMSFVAQQLREYFDTGVEEI